MPQERLAAAADRLEIAELLSRYAQIVDARDWDRLSEIFIPAAVIDFTPNGGVRDTYPSIVGYLESSLASFAAYQHFMTNFDIDVRGDEAVCRNYVFTQMVSLVEDGEELLADGGYYDSVLKRTPDGWRLTSFTAGLVWIDGDWPEGVPRPGWWGAFQRPLPPESAEKEVRIPSAQ